MTWKPVSELPDTGELVLGVCATRKNRRGEPEPLLIEFAADRLIENIRREPEMPRHLQLGITHFITNADVLAAFPLPKD